MTLTLQVENLGCSDQTRQALLKSIKLCLATLLSPKQIKPTENLPMNCTKGVCHALLNINRKLQLVVQMPGSIFFILHVTLLHHKGVIMLFDIVK